MALSYLAVASRASSLFECLNATQATVVTESTGEYELDRQVANRRIDRLPFAIVYPNNTDAVADVVVCARQHNVSAVARSGGHSYEGTARHTTPCGNLQLRNVVAPEVFSRAAGNDSADGYTLFLVGVTSDPCLRRSKGSSYCRIPSGVRNRRQPYRLDCAAQAIRCLPTPLL